MMYKNKRILALIPARSGSKGLPGKNIKKLLGKPLIAWTIEQALKSRYIDKVVVSTDSKEIATIAKKYGAEVPFLRPKRLATDKAKSIDAVFHAVDFLEKKGHYFDLIMFLQPTSPLRITEDIDMAIQSFFLKKAKVVISVCPMEHSPLWAGVLPKNLSMKKFINSKVLNMRRQKLPQFYRINGAIYFSSLSYLRKNKGFFGVDSFAYIMPRERSIDIDEKIDFAFAEFLLRKTKCQKQ